MSKIQRISVSNLKAISKKEANFNGATAIVTGGNNQGKTSFIRSLMDRMRSIKVDTILKQGEKEGFYEMELTTGEKFSWSFDSKGKEKMTFITERSIKTSLTKDICQYYFPKVFDVDAFLEMPPAKQREALQKIAGIDFTELDRELKASTEERTFLNRKKQDEFSKLGAIMKNLPEKEDVTGLEALQKELNEAGAHNERMKSFKDKIVAMEGAHLKNKVELEKLQARIEEIKIEMMEQENKIELGHKELKKPERQLKDAPYLAAIGQKIEKKKFENKQIEENNAAIKQQKIYEKALVDWSAADTEIGRLVAAKDDAIKNAANMPEGFGFSDEGITYNGFPYNRQSLSSSAIYIGALKLSALGLGAVRTLCFDASLLDRSSLEQIEEWSSHQGLQLLIERPAFEGGEISYELIEETK